MFKIKIKVVPEDEKSLFYTTQRIKDFTQKMLFNTLGDNALKFLKLGLAPIDKSINSEFQHPILGEKHADLPFWLKELSIVHFEFQSTDGPDDPLKFMTYHFLIRKHLGIEFERAHGRKLGEKLTKELVIRTVVVFSDDVKKAGLDIDTGHLNFHPIIVMMGDYDVESFLPALFKKINNGEAPTDEEIIPMVFLPMMRCGILKLQLAIDLIKLAKRITDHTKRQVCMGALVGLADHYLNREDFNKLMEVFRVTDIYKEVAKKSLDEAEAKKASEIARSLFADKAPFEFVKKTY